MKILHLLYESKGDYFGIGGVGMRAYEIYRLLKDRHDITLLCKKYPGAEDKEIDALRHIFVGSETRSLLKSLLSYAWQAECFVRRYGDEFDIVVEEFSPAIPTILPWTFKTRPVILQVQGFTGRLYFRKYNPAFALFLCLSERVRPHCYDSFIFASRETEKKLFSNKKNHSVVIPNGISAELLQTPVSRGTYLLYYGRIDVYGKGLDLLLKAYREFVCSFPDIKLIVAGDGRDMPQFQEQIRTLPGQIQKQIALLGWISDEKKPEVIGNAICAIFPSRHEVQGICVLEVMACGKPVIVSSIPEFSYVTENRAGISFRTGDHTALTEAMKEILHGNDRNVMGQSGRNWVTDFTWDRIARQYEDFLRDVAGGKGI
jgi:glycosyltransferase involved in cell wall biosynthesis